MTPASTVGVGQVGRLERDDLIRKITGISAGPVSPVLANVHLSLPAS